MSQPISRGELSDRHGSHHDGRRRVRTTIALNPVLHELLHEMAYARRHSGLGARASIAAVVEEALVAREPELRVELAQLRRQIGAVTESAVLAAALGSMQVR